MAVDDFLDSEVAVAVAAAAVVFSPRVRGWLRKGAVYGLAGVLSAGDAVSGVAKSVGQSAQEMTSPDTDQTPGNADDDATTEGSGTQ